MAKKPMKPKMLVLSTDKQTRSLAPKRVRVSKACVICRRKKRRCDGKLPCSLCERSKVECSYKHERNNNLDQSSNGQPDNIDYKELVELLFDRDTLDSVKQKFNVTHEIPKHISVVSNKEHSILPPRDIALRLIHNTWKCGCVLFRFYHRPTIIRILNLMQENPDDESVVEGESLVYSVLAVGALFTKDPYISGDVDEYYHNEAVLYFLRAKQLIDFSNINNIFALQTIFMMSVFLLCTDDLERSYFFIGLGLRSSLEQNLHKRNSNLEASSMIEIEIHKRLFWSIYKFNIYISRILGKPMELDLGDITQDFPLNIDDDRLTETGVNNISIANVQQLSSCGISNEHTTLSKVMSRRIISYTMLKESYSNLSPMLRIDYEFSDDNEREFFQKPQKLIYLDYLFIGLLACKDEDLKSLRCIETAKKIVLLVDELLNDHIIGYQYRLAIDIFIFTMVVMTIIQHTGGADAREMVEEYSVGTKIMRRLKEEMDDIITVINLIHKNNFPEYNYVDVVLLLLS